METMLMDLFSIIVVFVMTITLFMWLNSKRIKLNPSTHIPVIHDEIVVETFEPKPEIPTITEEELDHNIGTAIGQATKGIGRINLYVTGQTGVGKSTLIRNMFSKQLGDIVRSGKGEPITQEINEYKIDNLPLSIFDTPGFLLDDKHIEKKVKKFVEKRNKDTDPTKHIHLAWFCINSGSSRIQLAEINFVKHLSKELPFVLVLTQCYSSDEDFLEKVKEAFSPYVETVLEVLAEEKVLKKHPQDIRITAMGLDKLNEASIVLLPEAQAHAFVTAQKVDLHWKKVKCQIIIGSAVTAATAVGASPIPFTDAFLLCPIEAMMVTGISKVFGMHLTVHNVKAVLGIVGGGVFVGRAIATTVLKFVPGVGTVAGGVIGATTAAAMTTAFGEIYLEVLCDLWERANGDDLDFDTVLHKFQLLYNRN